MYIESENKHKESYEKKYNKKIIGKSIRPSKKYLECFQYKFNSKENLRTNSVKLIYQNFHKRYKGKRASDDLFYDYNYKRYPLSGQCSCCIDFGSNIYVKFENFQNKMLFRKLQNEFYYKDDFEETLEMLEYNQQYPIFPGYEQECYLEDQANDDLTFKAFEVALKKPNSKKLIKKKEEIFENQDSMLNDFYIINKDDLYFTDFEIVDYPIEK